VHQTIYDVFIHSNVKHWLHCIKHCVCYNFFFLGLLLLLSMILHFPTRTAISPFSFCFVAYDF